MSTTSGPIMSGAQKQVVDQRNNKYRLVVDSLGNQLREYEIDRSEYNAQQKVYKWRQRTHHPIIKVMAVQQSLEKAYVCLRCEHAVVSLSQVGLMRIQQVIYCMSEMLLGYQQVLNRLGYVCVEESMIGLNSKGEILLWVNSNPVANTPGSFQLIRHELVLLRILQILSRKSSPNNNSFFLEIKNTPKTFTNYLDFLMQFKHKHKLKITPRINLKRDNLFRPKNDNNVRAISSNSIICGKDQQQVVVRSLKQIGSKTTHLIPVNQHQQGLITSMSTNFIRSPHTNYTLIPQLTLPKQSTQYQSQIHPLNISQARSNDNFFAPSMVGSGGNFKSTKSSFIQNDNSADVNALIMNNNNGNNLRKQHKVKSSMKINFSYSQKRNDILLTPRQENFARDYTSDKQLPLMTKLQQPLTRTVQQFTLVDTKKETIDDSNKDDKLAISKSVMLVKQNNRKIVPTYSIVYSPDVGTVNMRTELQLKRSMLSGLSQKTCKSGQDSSYKRGPFNKVSVCDNNKHNKTSMTTNHRSVTQSFQSLGNCSNTGNPDYAENQSNIDDTENADQIDQTGNYFSNDGKNNRQNNVLRSAANEHWHGLGRKAHNNMFASDSSVRVSSSVIEESQPVKNTKSILIDQSQVIDDSVNNTNVNHQPAINITNNNKGMYTFGGLIIPGGQIKSQQQQVLHQMSCVKSSPSKLSTSAIQPSQQPQPATSAAIQSIEQFYKLLSLRSQKKSMILPQAHHPQLSSQTYQVNLIGTSITPCKQSQESHQFNLLSPTKYYSLGNPKRQEEFDYNKWRGLKGLLNQSSVYELKQSIHCGPEVRAPVDFKLELLDKFGREITHSILPNTPNRKDSSSCVKSIFIDEQQ